MIGSFFNKTNLFFLPLVFCAVGFAAEHNEVLFNSLVVDSDLKIKNHLLLNEIAQEKYRQELENSEFPTTIEKITRRDLFLNQFISKKFIEQLSWFSDFELHRVCLFNRNKILLGKDQVFINNKRAGTIALIQADGYSFDVEINQTSVCKNVNITKFKNSPSRFEYVYIIVTRLQPSINSLSFNEKQFSYTVASTTLDTSSSRMVIDFNWKLLPIVYIILLLAWSVVFFQLEKIYKYSIEK